jgi:acetyl esterase
MKCEGINVFTSMYKKVGDTELNLKIYNPPGWCERDQRAAVIFFFGGGRIDGSIEHFQHQSEFLASNGIVAITPEKFITFQRL